MKKIKKVLAVLVTLAMLMAMSLTAFAASAGTDSVFGTSDDTGSIVVRGIEEAGLNTVKAYPIVVADYDDNGNFSGYVYKQSAYAIEGFDYLNPTKAGLEEIEKVLVADDEVILNYNTSENYYYADNLKVGMYLVVVPDTDSTTYSVAVVSIQYDVKEDNTGNEIEDGDFTLPTVIDGVTWMKKDVDIDVDKTATTDVAGSANIGDIVEYDVVIDNVPSYSGEYPVLKVTDKLSDGLTYDADSLVITVKSDDDPSTTLTLVKGTHYTVTPEADGAGAKVEINFVVDGVYTLNEYAGYELRIEYNAELNTNAEVNGAVNKNDVTLDYTRDSKVEGDDDTSEDETYTYTFDVTGLIVKTDTEGTPLGGATFEIYTKNGDEKVAYENSFIDGEVVSAQDTGIFNIKGLEEGVYYLKEIEAPDEYSINTHEYKLEIDATYEDEILVSYVVKVDDTLVASFTVTTTTSEDGITTGVVVRTDNKEEDEDTFEIPNTKLSALPSTGGMGTTLFTIGGCIIMILAAALFFVNRRRSAE